MDKLTDELNSCLKVWVDQREMLPGVPLPTQMAAAIGSATYLLPIISRSSTQSSWVRDEISLARVENITVIPIRIDDAPMPPEINHLLYVDFARRRFTDAVKILLETIDRDLVIDGKLNLERLAFWGDARVQFRDSFTAVISTKPKVFASAGFKLDEPLYVTGFKTINVHVANAASSEFTGYSKVHPKMLKLEVNGKPILPRIRANRAEDDSTYVKPRDGVLIFTIPQFLRQVGHISKLELVIGKARLCNFEVAVALCE